jgi:hypothetical protein
MGNRENGRGVFRMDCRKFVVVLGFTIRIDDVDKKDRILVEGRD